MRMITTVNERGLYVSTFRYISVWMMETTARWTPITPQMEAKVMLGRHIWEYAQMADALGKRTFELRLPEQNSMVPAPAYGAVLKSVLDASTTADRIATLYDGFIPGFIARNREYLAATDAILDEPSIIIIERNVQVMERQRVDAAELQRELKLSSGAAAAIAAREKAVATVLAEEEKVPA